MSTALMAIGAVASVVGVANQAKANRRAAQLQEEQQQLNTARSRRQAIRQNQIRRATAISQAEALGAGGGSGAAGGIGSLSSQLGEQFGFSTAMSGLSRGISREMGRAQTAQAVASIGGSVYNFGASLPKGE